MHTGAHTLKRAYIDTDQARFPSVNIPEPKHQAYLFEPATMCKILLQNNRKPNLANVHDAKDRGMYSRAYKGARCQWLGTEHKGSVHSFISFAVWLIIERIHARLCGALYKQLCRLCIECGGVKVSKRIE